MQDTSCRFEGILMPELRVPVNMRMSCFPLLSQGDTQSHSQILQPAKASPKKSTAIFSLINWTIWICERKQKNIWGENMNHVTVCFSLNHPDWLIISLNPKAADTANPLGITLLVGSANCFTRFNCLLLLYLHYFPPFPWFLVGSPISAVWKMAGGHWQYATRSNPRTEWASGWRKIFFLATEI